MFSVKFDTKAQELFYKDVKGIELEVQKAVNWYINQVYRDLSRQHGSKYTYITPTAGRKNLTKRSGKLLKTLKAAKYAVKRGDNWETGFNIPRGSYLYRMHLTGTGERTRFTAGDFPNAQRWNGRIMIPLRAALNPDGTPKMISDRMNLQTTIYDSMKKWKSADFTGEYESRFHKYSIILWKQVGRRRVPMYVLAKAITVPKRMNVEEKMLKYYDDLFDRIDEQVGRILNN